MSEASAPVLLTKQRLSWVGCVPEPCWGQGVTDTAVKVCTFPPHLWFWEKPSNSLDEAALGKQSTQQWKPLPAL